MISNIDSELLYFILAIAYKNLNLVSQQCVMQYQTCYVLFALNILIRKSKLRDIE